MSDYRDQDDFYEELRDSPFSESPASAFEEAGDPPKEDGDAERYAALERRLDTLEHRMGRTLRCVNHCQTDQASLRKELRGLIWDQKTDRKRLDGLRENLRLGLWGALGAAALGWLPRLAEGGRSLLNALASLLQVEPVLAAGTAVAVMLLTLVLRLVSRLVGRLTRRWDRRDEMDEDGGSRYDIS